MHWRSDSKLLQRVFQEGKVICVKQFPDGGRYAGLYDGYMGGTWWGTVDLKRFDWLLAQGYLCDTESKYSNEGCPVLTYRATGEGLDWADGVLDQ